MSRIIQYSVLKYVYSQSIGEQMNIGVMILFPDGSLMFRYPNSLLRLQMTYPDANIKFLMETLKHIEFKVKKLSGICPKEELDVVINCQILPKDDSALQFGSICQSLSYGTESNEITANDFFDTYCPKKIWSCGLMENKH